MEQNPPHQCRTHGEKKVEAETDALLQQLRGICAELEATMRDVSNAQLLGSTAVKAQVSNVTKTIDEHAGPASRREAFTAAVAAYQKTHQGEEGEGKLLIPRVVELGLALGDASRRSSLIRIISSTRTSSTSFEIYQSL